MITLRAEPQRNLILKHRVHQCRLDARVGHSLTQRCIEVETQPDEGRMGIIAWVVLGLIAGAIAKFLMPGRDPGGIFITIIIGIVGAVIGGFIGNSLGVGDVTGVNIWSIVLAVAGSVILLIIYRMVSSRRAPG